MYTLIFVDCEAPLGVGSPAVGDMTEFGAVVYPPCTNTFYGKDCSIKTFVEFDKWLTKIGQGKLVFMSDNPAYDWQWINFYFWKYFNRNPFGHSARRIGDFYAGLVGDFNRANDWKKYRKTKHDHNPVHDALGNAEAFQEILFKHGIRL
jgi:hypothetical protein